MIFENEVVIFDGAIGTELYERGFYINRPFEELNLTAPNEVKSLHAAYIDAGARVITTNTFSITKHQLRRFGIEDKQLELLRAALQLTHEACAQTECQVALSIGPTGELLEPLGRMSKEEVKQEFADIARLSKECAPFHFYLLETFTNLSELQMAIEGLTEGNPGVPILASISAKSTEHLLLETFAEKIGTRSEVRALGINCAEGASDLLTCLKYLLPLTSKPVFVRPNAGTPKQINGRYFYMTSPDYLGKFAKRYVEAGASGVGGCCGTGPLHIRAIHSAIGMMNARERARRDMHVLSHLEDIPKVAWQDRPRSRVNQILSQGKKIYSIEVLPPKSADIEQFKNALMEIQAKGAHLVNIPDGARASARLSSLHLASYIMHQPELSLGVMPHLTCRDRNLIGLQSDLLGLSVHNVGDVLLVTGDPPKLGNNKEATAVYDVDAIGLTHLVNCLNKGVSAKGEPIGKGTGLGIGVASNPTALNLSLEIERFGYKHEMGADFTITQPMFDAEPYMRWLEQVARLQVPHIAGIWPLVSLRNAEFLANEVPGVFVPKWVLEEMAKAGDNKEEGIKRGIAIAHRIMHELEPFCAGFCISAPLGKTQIALELLP